MNCLTLFSNVGIDEIYLKDQGINVVVANELEKDRAEFYKKIHPNVNMIHGDINDKKIFNEIVKSAQEKKCELVIATPPCQGMSIANAARAKKDDPRNSLIKSVVRIVQKIKPKFILIENVTGMQKTYVKCDDFADVNEVIELLEEENKNKETSSDNDYLAVIESLDTIKASTYNTINIMDYLKSSLPDQYQIRSKVLNASDYGTPQNRKRLIVLISKDGWDHPKPTTPDTKRITVRKAIGHLPSIEAGDTSNEKWHFGKTAAPRHIHWMKNTPTGKSAYDNDFDPELGLYQCHPVIEDKDTQKIRSIHGFKSTYKRMEWDQPAPTIGMTNGSINSQNNVHPGRLNSDGTYSDARVLSITELLILCGIEENFLDNFHCDPKQKDINYVNENFLRRVIGECFPPKFCASIIASLPKINKDNNEL